MIASIVREERANPTLLTKIAILWIVVMAVIVVRLILLEPGSRTLFPIYRTAGANWLASENLYPEQPQGSGYPLFRYSPGVAVMFIPLAPLPQKVGDTCWRLINAAALLAGVMAISQTLVKPKLDRRSLALLLALMIPAGLGHLSNGQCNALVVGLILLAFACVHGEQWNWAAGLLAVAVIFKLYPIAAAGLLTILHPRRFGVPFAIALGVGLALPFAFQSPEFVVRQFQLWLHYLTIEDRSTWTLAATNVDFQLALRVVGIDISLFTYRLIEIGMGMAFGLTCVILHWRRCNREQTLVFALGASCVWMTVFGPATESPTYLILAPSIAWGTLIAWRTPAVSAADLWVRGLMTVSFVGLLSLQLTGVWGQLFYAYRGLAPQPISGLIFLAALFVQSWRSTEQGRVAVSPIAPRSVAA